jgi:hypothetical protein
MNQYTYGRFAVSCILVLYTTFSKAQLFDSLQAGAGLEYHLSSKDYLPLWLVSNHYGIVADRKNDLSSFVRISNKNVIAEHEYQNDHGFYDYNDLTVSYGLSVYNNNHFKSTIAEEGYVKLEYKNWSLRAGRFEETTGDIDQQLSTGSLGVSSNALPIPKIGIAITDYTNIPFTNGWLQFKGTFAHGWLGPDRYIKNSYYHEKTFFLRAGAGSLKLYAGIEHFVEWGGIRGGRQLDRSWTGFWNAVFAKSTNTGNERLSNGAYEDDHRGVLEGGVYWENDDATLHGYLQKPFEGIHDISSRNNNGLAGLIVSLKNKETGLQKILFEILSTSGIDYHVASPQRESYYNNNDYKTGWEYQGNIIGTPLFINRTRAGKYFPEIHPFDWNAADTSIPGNANIINNRIFAIHIGGLYLVTGQVRGKTLLTYTKNYGSINDNILFTPNKNQFYGLQEISYQIPDKNLTITAGLGLDLGQLGSVMGGVLRIEWNITGQKNRDDLKE